jgi:hypothetical protein
MGQFRDSAGGAILGRLCIQEERPMPIRTRCSARCTIALTLAAAIAGTVVCTPGAVPARAADIPVEPRDLVPDTPTPGKPAAQAKQRPNVTLRPTSAVVTVGSPVGFEISTSIGGYGHIYVLSASGRVQVWMENVPIAASQRLVFPTGPVGIKAAAPVGREDLMLVVTRGRIDGFLGYQTTRVPRQLAYDQHAFKQALNAKFIDRPAHEWGYARATVEVVDRPSQGPAWGWDGEAANPWGGQWETE